MGRKLPVFLHQAGLKNIARKASCCDFHGEHLIQEVENTKQRLNQLLPILIEIFQDEKKAESFKNLYLEEIAKPENVSFHNKFIAMGTK